MILASEVCISCGARPVDGEVSWVLRRADKETEMFCCSATCLEQYARDWLEMAGDIDD